MENLFNRIIDYERGYNLEYNQYTDSYKSFFVIFLSIAEIVVDVFNVEMVYIQLLILYKNLLNLEIISTLFGLGVPIQLHTLSQI